MNKKIIISIVAVILIIALAIVVGKNLSKGDTQPTNTNPVNNATSTPNEQNNTPTPETAFPETPTPDASSETPVPTAEPSTNPSPSVDVSKMSEKQKEEYAKDIAKRTWEKNNTNKNVYYGYADRDSEGKYLIAVRDNTTTNELMWYKVDIKTGSCETL